MNRITLEERRAQTLCKIAECVVIPPAEALRNNGTRRTSEKHELLRRLKQRVEARGQTPWPAKF